MWPKIEVFRTMSPTPKLLLGGDTPNTDPVQIRNLEGVGPVKALVNTIPYAELDGESYAGSSTSKRNIVMTLGLNPNWVDQSIESLRHLLYSYFMPKRMVRLRSENFYLWPHSSDLLSKV